MKASPHLIGIVAGLVSAVLFTSLSSAHGAANAQEVAVNILAILLFCFAPLPLLIAGLGWGVFSAQIAFVVGTALVPLLAKLSFNSAILYAASVGLPGLVVSWLASLRRPLPMEAASAGNTDTIAAIEWYPVGRIVMWASVIAGTLVAVGIWMVGDAERYQQIIKAMFTPHNMSALKALAGDSSDPARLDRMIELFGRFVLPTSLSFTWLLLLLSNIWLAAKSAEISGQLQRPWPLLATLEYPAVFPVVYVVSIGLGALLPGSAGIMAMAFVGAFSLAYLAMGLTVVHVAVPDSPLKPMVLAGMYLGLLFAWWLFMPALILLGLGETVFQIRRRALEH